MSFFSSPNLDNLQVKQESGDVLTLYGKTEFANITGLTLSSGINGKFIPIIATGATNGDVFTYNNGKITLSEPTSSNNIIYDLASPTTVTVGGITANSVIAGCTVNNILKRLLVPDIPLSTSLSIATPVGGSLKQFGDSTSGNLEWNVTIGTNPIKTI
jgi:hypothetical protein